MNDMQTGFLQDKYKTDLNNNDFFDRIINVKLVTSKGNEYVIRSDYEIVLRNRTHYRHCHYERWRHCRRYGDDQYLYAR